MILHKEQIPPNQNFTAPNPQIPFDELGLRVVSRLQALPKPAVGKPVIGVNSFGFGGSNAHVVLEQAPAVATAPTCESRTARPQLLTISGASAAALRAYVEKFHSLLAEPDHNRTDLEHRRADLPDPRGEGNSGEPKALRVRQHRLRSGAPTARRSMTAGPFVA